ncbi:MAG: hypothetical protein JWN93_3752 [Hyphomicrobiales bacterium]|nr:hypothetical protein [Hyphomicrobiales bacterium]
MAVSQMRRFWPRCKQALAACLLIPSNVALAQSESTYVLGRGDTLEVVVSAGGQLTRRAQVGVSGSVAIPLVGEIPVAGLSTAAAAERIAKAFKDRGGYDQVDAVVEVVGYRPVFISGAVLKPGPYEYRPGMTVRQLMAMAGGKEAAAQDGEVIPDVLQSEYENVAISYVFSQIRVARLRAEAEGKETFPTNALDPAGVPARKVQDMVRVEQDQLKGARDDMERERQHVAGTLKMISAQLAELEEQRTQEQLNVKIAEADYERLKGAFSKGVIAAPRLGETQQALALVKIRLAETVARLAETRRLVTETQRRLERDTDANRIKVLEALQRESVEVARAQSTLAAARAKLQHARVSPRTPSGSAEQTIVRIFSVGKDGRQADPDAELTSGDTVEVVQQFTDAAQDRDLRH